MKRILLGLALLFASLAVSPLAAQRGLVTYSGAYNSGTAYHINDTVTYSGATYISLVNANTGNTPSSSPTQWGVYGAAAGSATPSAAVGSLSFSNGVEGYGDSKQCSTGTTQTNILNRLTSAQQNGQFWQLLASFGGDFQTYCNPGDTSVDMNNWLYAHLNNNGIGGPNYIIEIGTNDARNTNGATSNYQNSFKYILQGAHLFAAIPRANKVFAQDSTVTTSGTWITDANVSGSLGYQANWGLASTTNGSVINIPVTVGSDGNIVLWTYIADGNGGTFTVKVDSGSNLADPVTSSTTFNAKGYGGTAIASANGHSTAFVGYRFSGYSAGSHTVHVTVTSSTSSSNLVEVGGAAGLPAASANNPTVFASGVEYQNVGYASDATTATYDGIVSGLVTAESALGLNVYFENTRAALLNNASCGGGVEATMFTNCYADALHQNNTGAAVIAATYVATAVSLNPNLATGALRDPRLGPTSRYQFAGYSDYTKWPSATGTAQVSTTDAFGAGTLLGYAAGGQNGVGYGDFGTSGDGFIVGGKYFDIAQCGLPFCGRPSQLTAYLSVSNNGSICMFPSAMTGCSAATLYVQSNFVELGATPGYRQSGVWAASPNGNGVSTSTAATSSVNQSSNPFYWRGNCWSSSQNFPADLGFTNIVGSGSTPSETLTLTIQYGCGGTKGVDISAATQTNHLGAADATTLALKSAAPTVAAGQVGLGSTTAAASNCNQGGTLTSVAGCMVVNVAGTAHYLPYF